MVGCGPIPPPILGFTFIPFLAGDTFSLAKAFTIPVQALGPSSRASRWKLRETQPMTTRVLRPDMEMKTAQPYGVPRQTHRSHCRTRLPMAIRS